MSGAAGVPQSCKAVVENSGTGGIWELKRVPAFISPDQGNFQKLCWLISKELGGSAPCSLQQPKATSQISFAWFKQKGIIFVLG